MSDVDIVMVVVAARHQKAGHLGPHQQRLEPYVTAQARNPGAGHVERLGMVQRGTFIARSGDTLGEDYGMSATMDLCATIRGR
jgi:hypothetical protein